MSLKEAMTWLGQRPDVLFLGQGVGCPGTKMSADFEDVPAEKRLEFPVAEELQLGVSIGLALEGFVPVSVFPRVNFLWRAADQLVNHLDKLPLYSDYRPKVIVRTAVGSKQPLDAGPQHTGDYTLGLEAALKKVRVCRLYGDGRVHEPAKLPSWLKSDPTQVYRLAYECSDSTLVVEG